jgi:hypothetical protein
MNLETAIAYFNGHEGRVPHMYLDSVGLVTVGIGCMLKDAWAARALPFVIRGTSTPASPSMMADEWAAVHAQPKDRVASFYENCTKLDLPDAAINTEFYKDVTYFSGILRQHFPKYDSFPDPAQLGLLDTIYSVGEAELLLPTPPGYPHFCAAAKAEDWLSCAESVAAAAYRVPAMRTVRRCLLARPSRKQFQRNRFHKNQRRFTCFNLYPSIRPSRISGVPVGLQPTREADQIFLSRLERGL